jgi:hypothetical protein
MNPRFGVPSSDLADPTDRSGYYMFSGTRPDEHSIVTAEEIIIMGWCPDIIFV